MVLLRLFWNALFRTEIFDNFRMELQINSPKLFVINGQTKDLT